MNISIIGSVGVPACYGGFESLVENLLDYTPADIKYTIYCCSKMYEKKIDTYKNANLRYLNINANGISSILYDIISLWKARKSDVILILGVSGCMFLPLFRIFYKGRLITNIDGLEWKRQKWNILAKAVLLQSEKAAIKYSDIIIGDNKGITDYVLKTYNKQASLIAYGADHAVPVNKIQFMNDYPFAKAKYAVTVCRIEPENNIDHILKVFDQTKSTLPIIIVGNWKTSLYGLELFSKYSNKENIILFDSIYNIERINYIRSNASLYIHGHSAGGTNPSLVEAMNLSLSIAAFDCVYNRETTEGKALYWKTEEDLCSIISEINITQNGSVMKDIASKNYTWQSIAQKYNQLFRIQ